MMNPIALLPPLLQRGSTVLILALSISLVAVHAVLVALVAQRAGASSTRLQLAAPLLVGVFLGTWLAVGIVVGDGTNFPLTSVQLRQLITLVVGLTPLLIALAFLVRSRTLRAVNGAMPPSWLIWVQTYRMAGAMFVYPFLAYGVIPAGFAIPAGVGDFVTGALAPFVALAVARHRRHAIGWAVAWNLFGILDLLVAPTSAVLSQAQVIGIYPLSIIPLFLGPPLGILTHIYSLRNLAVARGEWAATPHSTSANSTEGRQSPRLDLI